MKVFEAKNQIFKAYMTSRCFAKLDGSMASVLYGDMFNHSSTKWNTVLRECSDTFCFYAESDILKNSEILNNYSSQFDLLTMFATHGFIDPELDTNSIYLIGIDDELLQIRRDDLSLAQLDSVSRLFEFPAEIDGNPDLLEIVNIEKRMLSP